MSGNSDKTAPEILADTGRVIFDTEDWQMRLALALGVARNTIRYWQNGKMRFDANHPALERLLEIADRRVEEVVSARDELRAWLARQSPEEP